MSAFEDNPFADEEEDETTSYAEATSRKREREEAAIEDPRRERSPHEGEVCRQLALATGSVPAIPNTVAASDVDADAQLQKEVFAHTDAVASGPGAPSVEDLLTGYDELQEEDEFNTLVVKAARLETEVKQKEKACNDELDRMSQNNRELRETVELLRKTILRIHEEIDSFRGAQSEAITEGNTCHGAVELLGDVQGRNGVLEQTVTALTERFLTEDSEGIVPASLRDRLFSCIVGAPTEVLDLSAFDSEEEKHRFRLCEEAMEKLRGGGMPSMALSIVEALMTMLRELVARYDVMYKSTRALQDSVAVEASSLRELAQESVEWYVRSASRALIGSTGALRPAPAEAQEGALGNQHLEATLHHLEFVLHQLLQVPNVIPAARQTAPSLSAASAFVLCQELESHTEALGKEVLRLRRLLATDTATLQHLSESQAIQETSTSEKNSLHTPMMSEWLVRLKNNLLERVSAAETLWRLLKDPVTRRNAPVVELQLAFYRQYVVMQEALLRLLCTLNSVLLDRAHIVGVIRQVALRDGDDTAVTVLAEKMLQVSENDAGDLCGELEDICTGSLRQFEDEASELSKENEVRAEQSRVRLQDVRNFFAHAVQTLDSLVYGATPASGPIQGPLAATLPLEPAEVDETPIELSLVPSEERGEVFGQMASNYHDEELQEEVSFLQRRNSALTERLRWLSTQPSCGAILRLRSVQSAMDVIRQKLEGFSEQETKWAALKDDLATVQGEVSAVQGATVEMRDKLNSLRERLHAKSESGCQ